MLCVPATSTAAERAFLQLETLYQKRSCLNPDNVDKILFEQKPFVYSMSDV